MNKEMAMLLIHSGAAEALREIGCHVAGIQ